MTVATKIHQALHLPLPVLLRKIWRKLSQAQPQRRLRRHDERHPTYSKSTVASGLDLQHLLQFPPRLENHQSSMLALAARHLAHDFDLLGSGWVRVEHGMACRGVGGHVYPAVPCMNADPEGRWLAGRINAANLREAKRRWQAIEFPYVPIDWQLDFKSGFRWSEATWHVDLRYGDQPGADVKVPWELARMQHLPLFAVAYGCLCGAERGAPSAERKNHQP